MRVFGKWICSFLLLYQFNLYAGISVISDLDDTIKLTNVQNKFQAIKNALWGDKIFSGAFEFYSSYEKSNLFILTASPSILRFQIKKTLKKREIFYESLKTRVYLWHWDKYKFKYNQIKKVFALYPKEKFILIGDDVGLDPEVYDGISNDFPERVEAIYIRRVKNRVLSSSTILGFSHFLEIAGHEIQNGRMEEEVASALLKIYLKEANVENIVPKFAYCPAWNEMDHKAISYVDDSSYLKFVSKIGDDCQNR